MVKLKIIVIRIFNVVGTVLFLSVVAALLGNLLTHGEQIYGLCLIVVGVHGFFTRKGSRHALDAIQKYEEKAPVNEWILWLIGHSAGFIAAVIALFIGIWDDNLFIEENEPADTGGVVILLFGISVIIVCSFVYPALAGYDPERIAAEAAEAAERERELSAELPDEEDPFAEAERNLRELMADGLLTQEEYDALTNRKS
ncbi:MAG: hypothetical protein IJ060_12395 [Oscillospiraceae bacterium]|nr:hypothetical protein [Oscillospiraceae bacterium]